MNFLEGIKRLFIIFSVLVVVAGGGLGWSENGPPYGCVEESSIKWDQPPSVNFSKMTDEELFDILRKADASGDKAKADGAARAIKDRSGPWSKYEVVRPALQPLVICPPKTQSLIKQVSYAAGIAAALAAVMFALWLCLRWIIVGFFPSAARRA